MGGFEDRTPIINFLSESNLTRLRQVRHPKWFLTNPSEVGGIVATIDFGLLSPPIPVKSAALWQRSISVFSLQSLIFLRSFASIERIAEKLEFHYTPKHGSWLNIAEIEFSVLRRQCLSRRIPDQETLKREVQAWKPNRRNQQGTTVHWRFTTDDARIKLKKLYPSIND